MIGAIRFSGTSETGAGAAASCISPVATIDASTAGALARTNPYAKPTSKPETSSRPACPAATLYKKEERGRRRNLHQRRRRHGERRRRRNAGKQHRRKHSIDGEHACGRAGRHGNRVQPALSTPKSRPAPRNALAKAKRPKKRSVMNPICARPATFATRCRKLACTNIAVARRHHSPFAVRVPMLAPQPARVSGSEERSGAHQACTRRCQPSMRRCWE